MQFSTETPSALFIINHDKMPIVRLGDSMFESMSTTDWLMILAIILAPLVAIQVERFLLIIKERRSRKLNVFHTLMTTRGTRLSPAHVEALNAIDIAFYGIRLPFLGRYISEVDRKVLDAWQLYFDSLNSARENRPISGNRDELFADLLTSMAKALKYQFDPMILRKGGYYPQWHADFDIDNDAIRRALREILEGRRPLTVAPIIYNSELAVTPHAPPEPTPPPPVSVD